MHSKRVEFNNPVKFGLFDMARSGGFEPPTAWFVARYSIQLSYERVIYFSTLAVREGFEPSVRD